MRETLGLLRAGWLSALSYRLNMAFSVAGLLISLVPLYFVAQALQPVVAGSIEAEGGRYFAFVSVGLAVLSLVSAALMALPNAIGGAVSSGVFEAIIASPARLPAVLLGMAGYDLTWATVRAGIMVTTAALLGGGIRAGGLPAALLALLLVLACYFGLGLGLAAMVLTFRTVGPLGTGLLGVSALLGGVYYSTTVIPSWIQDLSVVVPLTYALRAIRQSLLAGMSYQSVGTDLEVLAGLAALCLAAGVLLFRLALRRARHEGTLGQY